MQAVENVGMLSAASALTFLENVEDPRAVARTSAILIASFVNMLILVAAWKINDRAEFQGRGGPNPWRSFRDVVTNPHSRILIGVFFLEQLGFSALVALMPYSSDYVVNTPGSTELYLFGAIGSALVSIPL
jgi:Na+/melibiose symporter-like transporter